MNKLLKANLYKLTKEKSTYVLAAVSVAIAVIAIIIYKTASNVVINGVAITGLSAESLFLSGAQLSQNAGMLMVLGIAIFIGKEFSQNTIRNKIAVGYSKTKIYISNFIMSLVISAILYFVFELVALGVGLPMFGWGKDFVFSEFIRQLINSLCIIVTVSAVVNMIAMLTRNMVASIVASMIGIIAIPAILSGINMIPLEGGAKTFVEILMKSNFLGQSVLVAVENSVSFMVWVIASSVVVTAGTVLLGSYLFEKMDVK